MGKRVTEAVQIKRLHALLESLEGSSKLLQTQRERLQFKVRGLLVGTGG